MKFLPKNLINSALKEDLGKGDITSEIFIPKHKLIKANIIAKENFVLCGIKIVKLVFKRKDNNIKFKSFFKDGDFIKKGQIIATIYGKAHSILSAERVALNFLCLLSGIATKTREFVEKIKPYKVKIMDTRKTLPGLRLLEKYAVKIGGGFNHRLRLDEMILIKDNHLKILGLKGLKKIFASKNLPKNKKIEIEVKNLKEFRSVLKLKPDIIMLDNMNISQIKKALKIKGRSAVKIEVSGGINLRNVKKFASLGIDMISIGELTHSPEYVDISLEII